MAIAYISGTGLNGNPASSLTVSQDCTGATILWAGVWTVGNVLTSMTYNGVAMTLLGSPFQYNTGEYLYLYYMSNPPAGSNNATATFSSSVNSALAVACFSGAAAGGIPDSTATANPNTGTPISATTTTVADKCMSIMLVRSESGSYTASTNSTIAGDGIFAALFYSTALKTPAGSVNMQVTYSGGNPTWGAIIASFAPFAQSGGGFLLKMI